MQRFDTLSDMGRVHHQALPDWINNIEVALGLAAVSSTENFDAESVSTALNNLALLNHKILGPEDAQRICGQQIKLARRLRMHDDAPEVLMLGFQAWVNIGRVRRASGGFMDAASYFRDGRLSLQGGFCPAMGRLSAADASFLREAELMLVSEAVRALSYAGELDTAVAIIERERAEVEVAGSRFHLAEWNAIIFLMMEDYASAIKVLRDDAWNISLHALVLKKFYLLVVMARMDASLPRSQCVSISLLRKFSVDPSYRMDHAVKRVLVAHCDFLMEDDGSCDLAIELLNLLQSSLDARVDVNYVRYLHQMRDILGVEKCSTTALTTSMMPSQTIEKARIEHLNELAMVL